ncbi:class I adenylate-forming enzyme family protein [Amycolatopsis granulosa]|uniref:class I adenylate-forming enzyme family protein n=1 Tax=Amycolatopsis granulosa TaxID=185684 RepID=UPI00141DA8D9|nr:AMP-binding protein [Amycolatopsis granulosa]NIH84518.1 acyl-CoA synthetase (AMP-forming)/AMP-acid ligase II [Amycolatopsis granulosa]
MGRISGLLAVRAAARPDEVAFLDGTDGRELSWRAVASAAQRWRSLAHDLPPRTRMGLVAADPLAFTSAYLGCLAAGLTAVPVDPRLPAAELDATLDRLRTAVVATDRPDLVPRRPAWVLGRGGPRPVRATRPRPAGTAVRPAVLLTSSGTTGAPKGIPLSEWQLLHTARRVARHHRLGPGERGYTPLPLFHVNAQVMGLLATVVGGGSLVVDQRFSAGEYWDRVTRWAPTWLNTVPAILASLARRPAPPAAVADRIRFARSASAPLSPGIARRFTARTGIGVLETYGMSEAAGQITANPLDPALRRAGSVGLPVGVGLVVAAPDGTALPPGERGEVRLRGRQVVSRYLDLDGPGERIRPARGADGWLSTGDVGVRDADGYLTLDGRVDDVINRGGEQIYPREIEDVLLAHPAVGTAAVVGAPDERLGQVPVAFVTAASAAGLERALQDWCGHRLPRHKRPAVIEVTAALPLGPTGKVLRRELRVEAGGR